MGSAIVAIDLAREQRFLQLFLPNERRIYAFILALVPHWSDADDVLQETSAVLWRKLDEFTPGTDFLAWALTIARFQVLNYRKKQGHNRVRLSNQTLDVLADEMTVLGQAGDARRDALAQCLAKLSKRDQELIELRYQPDATTQSVAQRVGRSLKAVYKALNRIHSQLLLCIRQTLASEGVS